LIEKLLKRMIFAAALCLCVLLFPLVAQCLEIVDDTGQTVSLERPATRIIPLYGAFAEMLYTIGAGSSIAARTQADQFPPEIVTLPSIGTHMRPNLELVIGLKPDLVIQSGSRREDALNLDSLRRAGIPVAVFAPKSFEEIFSTMQRLGVLSGREEEAKTAVSSLQSRLDAVTKQLEGAGKRQSAFFEVRGEPLTGAGRASIVHRILERVGALNVVDQEKAVVQYNFETLLLKDPDVYIIQEGPMNRKPLDPGERPHFARLKSVREGRVIFVDEMLFSRPGPRCVDAVEQLAAELYPDIFKGKNGG
jgi:iron complex transport system substrate-binding protein